MQSNIYTAKIISHKPKQSRSEEDAKRAFKGKTWSRENSLKSTYKQELGVSSKSS